MEDKPQASGSVYVLSNRAMEGYIKIGRTDGGTVGSVVQRMKSLKSTSVPLPFDCEHASAVADAAAVEKVLHEAFGDYRVSPKGEFFFGLAPFRVTAMLRLLEIEDVTPPSGQTDIADDEPIKEPPKPPFRFDAVGIPNGAILQWADDPEKECQVDGETTYVLYEGRRWAISTLARELKEWKSTLESMADREDDMELKVLVRSLDSVEPYLGDTSVYDISQFTRALSEIGLTMPAVDADYVTMFLEK